MKRARLVARLFLNDHDVGAVDVKGWDHSWGFGEFAPADGFTPYAGRFGEWSRLIHAGADGDGRLDDGAREALREVEYDIDRIHAKLFLVGPKEWRTISQLNIDGPLIEWKEDFSGEVLRAA